MAGEWRETPYGPFVADFAVSRLVDLCDPEAGIQTGPFGSQLHKEDYVQIGTPIITVEHLGENRILHQDVPKVSDSDRDRLSRYLLQKGDIVFSRVGSVDRRALVRSDEDGWMFSGRCLRVRPDPAKIDSTYLSYFFGLPTFKEHVRAVAVGATMPSLNTALLSELLVPYPPNTDEQRAIAHILGTLDDKIELNRRMSETLEAMARALFKSWFIDFDTVRAKIEGRWRKGDSLPGLPAHLYDLFPDRLVDSELGEIPEGWEVPQLADLLIESNQRIGNTQALEYSSTNDGLQLRSERFNKTLAISSAKNKLIRRGYLVFGLSRRVLNFGLMRDELGSVSSAYKVFKVREDVLCSDLLERLMRLKTTYFYMAVSASSREGQSVSSEGLSLLKVVVPPRRIQDTFHLFDTRFTERIAAIKAESRTLAALRDALLPKLICGELRVEDAEKFIGRVV